MVEHAGKKSQGEWRGFKCKSGTKLRPSVAQRPALALYVTFED